MDALPSEVMASILERVGSYHELGSCFSVSKEWNKVCCSCLTCLDIVCDAFAPSANLGCIVGNAVWRNRETLTTLNIRFPKLLWAAESLQSCLSFWLDSARSTLEHVGFKAYHSHEIALGDLALAALLRCHKLKSVVLAGFSMPSVDPFRNSSKLEHLRALVLHSLNMSDDALVRMLELCPILETLKTTNCQGFSAPKIVSPSIRLLHFDLEDDQLSVSSLVVRAPKMHRLTAGYIRELQILACSSILKELTLCSEARVSITKTYCVERLRLGDHYYDWSLGGLARVMADFANTTVMSVEIASFLDVVPLQQPQVSFLTKCEELEIASRDSFVAVVRSGMLKQFPCLRRVIVNDAVLLKEDLSYFVELERCASTLKEIVLRLEAGDESELDFACLQRNLHQSSLRMETTFSTFPSLTHEFVSGLKAYLHK